MAEDNEAQEPLSAERLAEIREHVGRITPGYWSLDFTDDDFNVRPNNAAQLRGGGFLGPDPEQLVASIDYADKKDDLLFIQNAPEYVRELLAEVDRLREENAYLQQGIDKILRSQPNFHWHE